MLKELLKQENLSEQNVIITNDDLDGVDNSPKVYVQSKKTARELDKQRTAKKRSSLVSNKSKSRKNYNKIKKISKTAQDTMPYIKVCDTYIFQLDINKYSKSYVLDDISYSAVAEDEQERIFLSYGAMLNGFDSTAEIQLSLINNHIDKKQFTHEILLKTKDDKYDKYRDEYNSMLLEKMEQGKNGVSCKKCITITVSAFDYELAKQKLDTLEVHLKSSFNKISPNIIKPMTANERVQLLAHIFRGSDITIPHIDEKVFKKRNEKSACCPDYFEFKTDYFMYNNKYARIVFLRQYPSSLKDKILKDIIDTNLNLIVTVNIAPVEPDKAVKKVKRQLTSMRSNKIAKQKKAAQHGVFSEDVISDDLRSSLEEAEEFLSDLQSKNQRMFLINLLVMITADDYDELEINTEKVNAIFRQHLCAISTAFLQQEDGMASVLPLGNCKFQVRRTTTTDSTCVFMPFSSRELNHKNGIYYGQNALTNNLLISDRNSLLNPNGFILGSPGSGKSFGVKREIVNVMLSTNDDIIIVDPEGEYGPLVKALGGEIIYISENSKSYLNPMDLESPSKEAITDKLTFLLGFFETITGGKITPEQKTIIDECLNDVYYQYIVDPLNTKMPTLENLYNALKNRSENPQAHELYMTLKLYVKGSMSIFNNRSNVSANNRIVCYDIQALGKQLKSLGLMIILEALWTRIAQNRIAGKSTRIYIDEIYLLFNNEESANFLFELYKRARKWGGIPTGITQNIEDLLKSPTGRSMLSNSEFILMYNQSATDREQIAALLKISDTYLEYVTGSEQGSGLMKWGGGVGGIIPFKDKFPKNTELYRLMTTKFEEKN